MLTILLSVPGILITFLYGLLIIAGVILVLYLFERFVAPIDRTIKGIFVFIAIILVILWALGVL